MTNYLTDSEYSLTQRELELANKLDSYHHESYELGMSDTYLDMDSYEYIQMY